MDRVQNNESLYRFVKDEKNLYNPDGTITAQAFADSGFRPSVDRAILRNYDPQESLKDTSGGIISFSVLIVRGLERIPHMDGRNNVLQEHETDVEPVFEVGNPAHAEIFMRPECPSEKVFRRLRHALARTLNDARTLNSQECWALRPIGLRQYQ